MMTGDMGLGKREMLQLITYSLTVTREYVSCAVLTEPPHQRFRTHKNGFKEIRRRRIRASVRCLTGLIL